MKLTILHNFIYASKYWKSKLPNFAKFLQIANRKIPFFISNYQLTQLNLRFELCKLKFAKVLQSCRISNWNIVIKFSLPLIWQSKLNFIYASDSQLIKSY